MLNFEKILSQEDIRNFSVKELTRGNEIPCEYIKNIIPTVKVVQKIRDFLGVPILVKSCFRPPEYNKKVGGAADSLHLIFNAIDFKPKEFDSIALEDLYRKIESNFFKVAIPWSGAKAIQVSSKIMGLGLYPSFVHIDTRGLLGRVAPARWDET